MPEEVEVSTETMLTDLSAEQLLSIGVNQITIGASADTKVSLGVKTFESMGAFASMSVTYDLSAFSGKMPVTDIMNLIAIPIRNSSAKYMHQETLARVEEVRAVIEGVRDGKSYAQIEDAVNEARKKALSLMRSTFETRK